ncbi:3-methyladenine DNA glycosylase [Deinococcus sp. Arct2-2]|uniref:3-methyladenine DNA glycosylase n=1 Tax=Deinococcus sp. Arct2-2 TaxID=2568653 RepID=UPI001454C813|nr:3-methyladenine DNA glycosylase [Deinococcus sp. Arct2-2]
MQLSVTPPAAFNFASTVSSHGWERLRPFTLNKETQVLTRIQQLPSQLARLDIAYSGKITVAVETETKLDTQDERAVTDLIATYFAFEWDLSPCYAEVANDPTYAFIGERGLGRLLLAPTMWENLVKTLFLTNTHARHTTAMAAKFCTLGDLFDEGHAFPTPEQVLTYTLDELEQQTGAGYRAKYIRALAAATASGFDPESLRNRSLGYDDIYEQIRGFQGFGPYSASYVLKLLGRFERVSIDTVMRRYFKEITGQHNATDHDIHAHYERFGAYQGLVAWWEVSQRADEKGELAFE